MRGGLQCPAGSPVVIGRYSAFVRSSVEESIADFRTPFNRADIEVVERKLLVCQVAFARYEVIIHVDTLFRVQFAADSHELQFGSILQERILSLSRFDSQWQRLSGDERIVKLNLRAGTETDGRISDRMYLQSNSVSGRGISTEGFTENSSP